MDGFLVRVTAYGGMPTRVGRALHRSGHSSDVPVPGDKAINDPNSDVVRDSTGASSDRDFDQLLAEFEEDNGCKVAFMPYDALPGGDPSIVELDVFEPAWDSKEEAIVVVNDLSERACGWIMGSVAPR